MKGTISYKALYLILKSPEASKQVLAKLEQHFILDTVKTKETTNAL